MPDLRGFGESDVGPDGFDDVPAPSHDLHALVHDHLGHERVVLVGGDLGGPGHPGPRPALSRSCVDRMVLFNSPLPYDKERDGRAAHRRPARRSDYFVRQGTDADGLAAELATPGAASALHRHVLLVSGSGPTPGVPSATSASATRRRLPHRAVRRRRQAAGSRSAPTRASSTRRARSEPRAAGAATTARPTLILFGPSRPRDLPRLRPHGGRRLRAITSGPFLLRDCGHFVPWEAPHALVSGTQMMAADLLAARRSSPMSRG